MNIFVVLALVLILAGGLYHRVILKSSVLSSQTSLPTQTPTLTPTPTPTSTPLPPPPSLTLAPRSPAPPPDEVGSDWQYPGSTELSPGNYQSSDSPDKITDWYQAKIKSLGLNIKTFIRTKANDRVLNKLVSSNGKTEIRVEIAKKPDESVTSITVAIDN